MLSEESAALHSVPQVPSVYRRDSQVSHSTPYKQMQNADSIVTMLHAIASESEATHVVSRALFVARATDRSLEHIMATRQLSHSCNLLMSRIAALQKIVTAFDQGIAGPEFTSLGELGLRAQTLAILLLLDELCDAMSCSPSGYQELFTGRLRTVEDVVWFLFDSLARINRRWLRSREQLRDPGPPFVPRVFQTTRPLLYRSAIRQAQRAIAALGADPDLARFLRAGSSRTDASQVRRACDRLADVFNIALTREPDPALFLAAAVLEPEELNDLTDADDTTS